MNDDVHDMPNDTSPSQDDSASQNDATQNDATSQTSSDGVRRIPVTDLDAPIPGAPTSEAPASEAPASEAPASEASQPATHVNETMTSDTLNNDNSDVTSAAETTSGDVPTHARAASSEDAQQVAPAHDNHDAFAAFGHASSAETEIDILRAELDRAHAELATLKANPEGLETLQAENKTLKDKFLRARADLENYRRRASQDVERARNSGADGIVLAVLPVYDDLGRALEAATADPSTLIPGIEAVREGLKRNLAAQGIQATGNIGERFDPTYHEALTSMPAPEDELKGTIAQVFQAGFMKDERLIRPAQVVVYQED
ncbi:MAG: nucleotide exchange factor GrpE [Deinococcota bacterium]